MDKSHAPEVNWFNYFKRLPAKNIPEGVRRAITQYRKKPTKAAMEHAKDLIYRALLFRALGQDPCCANITKRRNMLIMTPLEQWAHRDIRDFRCTYDKLSRMKMTDLKNYREEVIYGDRRL